MTAASRVLAAGGLVGLWLAGIAATVYAIGGRPLAVQFAAGTAAGAAGAALVAAFLIAASNGGPIRDA